MYPIQGQIYPDLTRYWEHSTKTFLSRASSRPSHIPLSAEWEPTRENAGTFYYSRIHAAELNCESLLFWSVVLLLAAPLITSAPRHVRGDLTQDGIACRDLYKSTQGERTGSRNASSVGTPRTRRFSRAAASSDMQRRQSRGGQHGSIPAALGTVGFLTELDVSSNTLTGPIPSSRGVSSHHKSLRNLTGPIPASLANPASLQSLDLSGNSLIPAPHSPTPLI